MKSIYRFFANPPYPEEHEHEVKKLVEELIHVGKSIGYLSERPGGDFNAQCRNVQARRIGQRLNEIGGFALMEYAYKKVHKKLGLIKSSHLEYAWAEIGKWMS